jgi:hypothetical protein
MAAGSCALAGDVWEGLDGFKPPSAATARSRRKANRHTHKLAVAKTLIRDQIDKLRS